jgi:hypothetical protein
MSLTVSGVWKTDADLPMQRHTVTLGYVVHVSQGLLASTPCTPGVEDEYQLILLMTQTDGTGSYSITAPEDTIVAYALLPGAWSVDLGLLWSALCQGGIVPDPLNRAHTWGTLLHNAIPGSAGFDAFAVGMCEGGQSVSFLFPCAYLTTAADLGFPNLIVRNHVGSPLLQGVVAVLASRSGTVWDYLSGGDAANIIATGYRPQILVAGFCQDSGQAFAITDATVLVTGEYGSETLTTDSEGLVTLSVVDPNVVESIQVTSGLPSCDDLSAFPSLSVTAPYAWQPRSFDGLAIDEIAPVCGDSVTILGALYCNCAGSAPGGLSADTYNNVLAVAWIDSGALNVAVHRGALKQIGSSTQGWEATQNIESADVDTIGLVYLPNGRLYLAYNLSGVPTYRTNDKLGSGPATNWSSAQSPSPAVPGHAAAGRGQQQAWRFRTLGSAGPPMTSGSVEFSQCRDNAGAVWTSEVVAVTGCEGPYCGGVWLGNQYGLLYTAASDGHVYWLTATNPASWSSGPGTDTGLTGEAVSLAQNAAGILCALLWDSSAQTCQAARSRDRGRTWEQDSAAITAIPALARPPTLVAIAHYFFAVYVVNNMPQFAASLDGGVTWR